ncbi:hypothetical protein V6N13_134659 [Hibiscus sabdariffa]
MRNSTVRRIIILIGCTKCYTIGSARNRVVPGKGRPTKPSTARVTLSSVESSHVKPLKVYPGKQRSERIQFMGKA